MVQLAFEEWLPDLPDLNNPGLVEVKNALPGSGSYIQQNSLVSFSTALDGAALTGFAAIKADGTTATYAGDGTKLYALGGATWTNVSKSGNYSLTAGERWQMFQGNNTVVAVAIDAPVQEITIGGANFADMITSTRKPQARYGAVIRDHFVLANVTDTTDGDKPARVWWSKTGDAADFDPAIATGAGIQDLETGDGPILGIIGGEVGIILQERAITRMTFEGPPRLFRFDKLVNNRGPISPGSIINFNRITFFIDRDGFYLFDGTTAVPVGKNKVDRYFTTDADNNATIDISTTVEPQNSLVCWGYKSVNAGQWPDRIITYNWVTQKWGIADVEHQLLFNDRANTTFIDDAGLGFIDARTELIDSDQFKGGNPLLGAFMTDNKLARFSGSPLQATFTPGELGEGHRFYVNRVRPLITGTTSQISVQLGVRELQSDIVAYKAPVAVNANGEANCRQSARYMRMRHIVDGGFESANGTVFDASPAGRR